MEKIQKTQCVISGGGPAGIMLGYLLARAGIDIVVLEKWPDFFRDFRGDTIHPSTMEVLSELGILDEFLKLPHNDTEEMTAHIVDKEIVIADFSKLHTICPYIAFIPQWDFLNFIAKKAKAFPTFHLLMETEATDILWKDNKAVGLEAKNKEGEWEILADLVIGADGRHSTIREKANMKVKDLGAPIDVLWFRLSRKSDGTKQSFGYVDQGKMMVLLDRDDYWQCAYILEKGTFEKVKSYGLEEFKRNISNLVPFLSSSIDELIDWEQIKFLSVSVDRLDKWYGQSLLCIGDCAHAMSPIGGVGINLAIQDAIASANVLIPIFVKNKIPTIEDLESIQKRRESPTRRTQNIQIFLHNHVIGPVLKSKNSIKVPFVFKLLKLFPVFRRIPARIIGIGFRPEHIKK